MNRGKKEKAMKRILSAIMVVCLFAAIPAGCSYNGLPGGGSGGNVQVPVNDGKGSYTGGRLDTVWDKAAFMTDYLYSKDNIMVSPLSLYYAMAMLANGAEGETLSQIESLLGADIDTVNKAMKQLTLKANDSKQLKSANSIWYDKDGLLKVNTEFAKTIEDYYGAEIRGLSFASSGAVREINGWVSKHTDKMIPEILDRIDSDTKMVLINALLFDAKWSKAYEEYQVKDEEFKNANGGSSYVKMMTSSENYYLENDYATGFIKAYENEKYSFVGILPKNEGEFDISDLDIKGLLDSASGQYDLSAKIPEFTFEYSTEMEPMLSSMGVIDAFDDSRADLKGLFTGMQPDENLSVDRVIQKTKIELTRKGTKAAAATAVAIKCTSLAPEPTREKRQVYLDRPFAFMIIDSENQIPIFIGKVTKL